MPVNRSRPKPSLGLKLFWLFPVLTGCYCLADATQALSASPQTLFRPALATGLAVLDSYLLNTFRPNASGPVNPHLANGLEPRSLARDVHLIAQLAQDPAAPENSPAAEGEATTPDPNIRVLVAEVAVEAPADDLSPALIDAVYQAIQTRAGETTSRNLLQEDINNIFATGFFSNVIAIPEDTDLGVKVTFSVQPNPVLTGVLIQGREVMPQTVVDQTFTDQEGRIINLNNLQEGIAEINQWYQDNGYVLAQVLSSPAVSPDGMVTLEIAEGVVNDIVIRFLNAEGSPTDEAGNPIEGKTQEYVITREIETQPRDVFNQKTLEADLQRVFSLGVFDDIRVGLEPAQADPRQVTIVINAIERNPESFAVGLGLSSASGVFGSVEYSQNNLLGRGQRAFLEAQIDSKTQTNLTASLNSPGSIDGQPMVPEALKSAAEAVINARRQEQQQSATQVYSSNIILETKEFVRSAQEVGNQPLAALALNNLASLHGSPIDRLATLDEALAILDEVNSPALRMHFLLRQARVHRQLSEPNRALDKYIAALKLLTEYQYQRDLPTLLGRDFAAILSDEWQITDNLDIHNGTDQIFDFVKLGILLDTTFTYSILGDYQAGLYLASSQDILMPMLSLTKDFNDFLDDDERIREIFDFNNNAEQNSGDESTFGLVERVVLVFEPLLPFARKSAADLLDKLPEAYRLKALRLLFFDFDETESVVRYEAQIDSYWQASKQQFNTLFYLASLAATNDEMSQYLSENLPYLVPIARDIHILLPSAYDVETQSWDADGLEEILVVTKNNILQYFDGIEDEQFTDLVNNFSALIEFWLRNLVPDERFEKDTPEYYRHKVELSQAILDDWPEQVDDAREFEWTKGFVLKWQADALYKLGDYASAIDAYNAAILWLMDAEEFYQNDNKVRNSLANDFLNQFKEVGWLGDFFKQFILSQQLTASLNSADAHLLLNKATEARELYKEALDLSDQFSESRTEWESVYEQSERAEFFYGTANAEAMLGNWAAATEAIQEAITINEASFPSKALSGGGGVLGLDFLYGYGVPYQGSISGSFKFDTNNPWLAANSSGGFWVETRCSTVTQYFACKQKYFGLYIDLLMQRHRQDPDAGHDVQAFEASERAKAFSFRRPDSVVSAEDQFAPARSLADIQSAFSDDNTLVLEFFLGEKASYLWLLNREGDLQVHSLPPRAVLEAKAQAFYDMLTSPPGRARPKTTAEVGQELSEMLLGPVADQLGTQRLVIVADGFLQYLPFSVLPNPNPDHAPSKTALQGEYGPVLTPLLLDHEIVHLPSASTLVALRENAPQRPEPTKELAFFANPVFNHRDQRVEQVKLFDWSEPMTAAELAKVEVLYSEIPATEQELNSVLASDLLPASDVQRFFGYDASLEAALSPELGQFRMVHFASHGIFNSKAPERSGVVLSGMDAGGVVRSGLLSPTYAFNEMDLSATELVVLSGCRTGLSQGQVGREGVTGLTSGLFDAGAERVVASLWSVQDNATRELMNRFYKLMLDPENPLRPAEALTAAQRSMWNEPRWQTPYNWAAFTLQGEWQ